MKAIILSILSVGLLLAATPAEREAKLQNVVDMNIKHTDRIEKRISKIEIELEKKAKQRAEKAKLLEAKIKKRDDDLQVKAAARENRNNGSGL